MPTTSPRASACDTSAQPSRKPNVTRMRASHGWSRLRRGLRSLATLALALFPAFFLAAFCHLLWPEARGRLEHRWSRLGPRLRKALLWEAFRRCRLGFLFVF